ncbi:MAG: crossover junction endodeoxyribonuclease RuvC [Candidatus Gracilibacteria bacterium]|nr:crossover junction endodeoxyribonuclease RuvC [Candidatus Gracilibacteria bacterium]
MIIFGIDPGTTTIGYAIIEKKGNEKILLDYGIIHTTPKISLKDKILEVSKDLNILIQKYSPNIVVIEKLFFSNNVKTAIDVSHVRGVVLYEFAKIGVEILEYTPLELKSAICGNGKANKLQLQNAIKIFFGLNEIPKPDDAADAIGLAYMGVLKNSF